MSICFQADSVRLECSKLHAVTCLSSKTNICVDTDRILDKFSLALDLFNCMK